MFRVVPVTGPVLSNAATLLYEAHVQWIQPTTIDKALLLNPRCLERMPKGTILNVEPLSHSCKIQMLTLKDGHDC